MKRDRHQSLYFDYQEYAFHRPPELDGQQVEHAVAVVGAGPVGLAVALDLARRGIAVTVLEKDCMVSEGSRAICVSRRSLEILQGLGVADTLNAKALPWTSGRSFYQGREIYRLQMPHSDDERYFPMVNIQQNYIEKFLVEACQESPGVSIRWRSEVVGLRQLSDEAQLTVRTPEGDYEMSAAYVVAADGARSVVRELMGLALAGESYEGRYLIADIRLQSEYPTERRAWFDPPSNPGSTVLMHKQPDDIWRVDFQLIGDEALAEELSQDHVCRRIQQQLDMCGEEGTWELDWYSIYRAHCLCLDDYVHGRVLFAGDAAHLVPIFGVRGLNSGFADAGNLAWKLAYVLKGLSQPELLETYTQERRSATLEIFREAGKSTQFMTPQTRGFRLLRDAALSLALSHTFVRELVNPRQTQPYDYLDSALNALDDDDAGFERGPRAGAPAPNLRLEQGGFLLDFLGAGFTVIVFRPAAGPGHEEPVVKAGDLDGETLTVIVVSRKARSQQGATVLADTDGHVLAAYGAREGTVYLIRPDGHVCGRWHEADSEQIRAAVWRAAMIFERDKT